jgi:hypothetical protein
VIDTESGNTTAGAVVTPFSYGASSSMGVVLDVSSPASTVTVENTSSETATGSELDLTATATAGFADTAGISDANDLGDFDSYHAVHDGTSEPILYTGQGLISAVGGQDLNALEFVGAEVHVGGNGANNAMVVDEGWSGAGPITSWVSHPSAIGYRLQGVVSAGSGSGGGGGGSGSGSGGGGTITIAAVSPDFDSGMNDGTDGQELERVANFYTGTEENPTSAQSAPTPRAEQDISHGVPPGTPIAVPTSTKGSSDGEDPPPSNLPPAQGPGTDPGDHPPPPTTVPAPPVPGQNPPRTVPPGGYSSPVLAGIGGFFAGVGQGVLNTLNGLTDDAIDMVINEPIERLNDIAGLIPGAPQIPTVPKPDWSNGTVTHEDLRFHNVSKKAGAFGVEVLVTLGAGAAAGEARALQGGEALAEEGLVDENQAREIWPQAEDGAPNNAGSYVRSDAPGVQRSLPKDKYGVLQPDVDVPHTQLGRSTKSHGAEPQAREWKYDDKGRLVPNRDLDFTDHNFPDIHSNPHQHKLAPVNPGRKQGRN